VHGALDAAAAAELADVLRRQVARRTQGQADRALVLRRERRLVLPEVEERGERVPLPSSEQIGLVAQATDRRALDRAPREHDADRERQPDGEGDDRRRDDEQPRSQRRAAPGPHGRTAL
jgi:hypothetical protein